MIRSTRAKYPTCHVPSGPEAVAAGLTFLREWPTAKDGVIVTPTKDQLTASLLADAIGPASKTLAAGRAVRVGPRRIWGASLKTFRSLQWTGGPILGLWLDEKDLRIFDTVSTIEALCVVPWLDGDIASWVKATGAINLLKPEETPSAATISDPVVLEAMKWLTGNGVNLSTGLAHPLDKARAVGAFRLLKKGRHAWVPEEIYAWAIANGWETKHADDLREVADKIAMGRSLRVRDSTIVSADQLDVWRRRAAGVSE